MSHTQPSSIESDQCTIPNISQRTVVSNSCNPPHSSAQTLPSPPCTPSPSSSLNRACQRRTKENTLDVDQRQNEQKNDQEQDGLPLTAAGLTRALETTQGQSLTEILNISTTNPSHLFWVPASQHPELAPTEFEKYVSALRASAKDKGKVKRRRSVLSVSFTADDDDDDTNLNDNNDDDDDDDYSNHNKDEERQSALEDLENKRSQSISLVEDLDYTSQNNKSPDQTNKDTTKTRKERLRRSMSLNMPGNKDRGTIPDFLVFDRNSTTLDQSPVLVPKTDRPLSRRGARTRFQRTSSITPSSRGSTDSSLSNQHRWPRYRGSNSSSSSSSEVTNTTTPISDNIDAAIAPQEQIDKPFSLSDDPLPSEDTQLGLQTILSTITKELQQDQQQQHDVTPMPSKEPKDSTKLGPQHSSNSKNDVISSSVDLSHQSTPKPSSRERKSSWSWSFWSDDKKARAGQSSVETESNKKNETDKLPPMITSSSTPTNATTNTTRFGFSSLFSRKSSSASPSSTGTTDERTPTTMIPPKDFALNKMHHHHRLPIHVERAVYRLSHIKLANPRRPLRDQVLISNFMFWYLSIITQQQAPHQVNDDTPPSPRPISPRTPQQIVAAASKKKKKRLTRKSEQQPSPSPDSQPLKHIPSSYQQHHPSSSPPPPEHHTKSGKSWQSYTDVSSKQQSTGFVIPEDYLHPSPNTTLKNNARRQPRSYAQRNSSSSSSSDEGEDDKALYAQSQRH